MAADVLKGVDFVASCFTAYWNFCLSNFWTAIPITLGVVSFVWKLIKKVFR